MKKKTLLFICLLIVSVIAFASCSQVKDDSQLREEGYNVVALFDCGRYENVAKTADEDAAKILYGDILITEKSNYIVGQIENYQVRQYYFNKTDVGIPEPGTVNGIPSPLLQDRNFVGWYVASVVEFKLDENGNPIKNSAGQYEYGAAVPQDTDVMWNFDNNIGAFDNNAAIATKYVYDATQPLDAQVTVGGQTVANCVELTNDQLGYSAENGFNVYLYAKWTVQPKYVVKAQVGGEWKEVYRTNPSSSGKMPDVSTQSALKQNGKTFYALYEDQGLTTKWDSEKKFNQAFTGGVDSLRPYVVLYADYLEGDWVVVRKNSDFTSALMQDKNIYLDVDLTISNWVYVANYSKEFNGNDHVVTLTREFTNPADRTVGNIGLFGTIASTAKIYNVEFKNVVVNVQNQTTNPLNCGILAGVVEQGATLTGVKVEGKITYAEYIITAVTNGSLIVNHGGTTAIGYTSWYGINESSNANVEFTQMETSDAAE